MIILVFLLLTWNAITGNEKVEDEGETRESSSTHSLPPTPKSISQFKRPENPPKYFAIDLDGTFFTNNEEAMKRNVEAFAKAKELGYTPFFCTGQRYHYAIELLGEEFVKRTKYEGYPGVYRDGSFVYDQDGSLILTC